MGKTIKFKMYICKPDGKSRVCIYKNWKNGNLGSWLYTWAKYFENHPEVEARFVWFKCEDFNTSKLIKSLYKCNASLQYDDKENSGRMCIIVGIQKGKHDLVKGYKINSSITDAIDTSALGSESILKPGWRFKIGETKDGQE